MAASRLRLPKPTHVLVSVIAALGLFTGANLTEDAKTAFAIVVHGAQFLVTTAWGIGYMLVSPVGFAELAAALRRRA